MGIFNGILLVSDLDGTLLGLDHLPSRDTLAAINYFQDQGGLFTIATGRRPKSMQQFLNNLHLNAPAICYNGATICDSLGQKVLWEVQCAGDLRPVIDLVIKHLPQSGITIYQGDHLYSVRLNQEAEGLIQHEMGKIVDCDYRNLTQPWTKVIFTQAAEETKRVREFLKTTAYFQEYQCVQSAACYYEILPKGATKGSALSRLARMIKQDMKRTIAVGDNENDTDMLQIAAIGIAVENALPSVKAKAHHITVHHQDSAIAQIINDLASGTLRFLNS
jgi:Cof subfamily protein (haloacid dehalogenase superfamily)